MRRRVPLAVQQGSVVSQFMALWTAFFQRAKRNSLSVRTDGQVSQARGRNIQVAKRCISSGSDFLTVGVDLRFIFLWCDLREVTGVQTPHLHPLCRPRCHGCTQSRGLGHGGPHWTRVRHTGGKTWRIKHEEQMSPDLLIQINNVFMRLIIRERQSLNYM